MANQKPTPTPRPTPTRKSETLADIEAKYKDIEAEKNILASMMQSPDAAVTGSRILTTDDFYYTPNQILFETMLSIINAGRSFDQFILKDVLKRNGTLDEISETEFFNLANDGNVNASMIDEYAAIVRRNAMLRRRAAELISDLNELEYQPIADRLIAETMISNTLGDAFAIIQTEIKNPNAKPIYYNHSIPPFKFGRGRVTGIMGAPGSAKSAGIQQVEIDVLFDHPSAHVFYASLEMSARDIGTRALSYVGGIPNEWFEDNKRFTDDEIRRINEAERAFDPIRDRFHISPLTRWDEIAADAVKTCGRYEDKIFVLDYLQRVQTDAKSLRESASLLMDNLRGFARNGWAVIVISSVSRPKNDKTGLSDYDQPLNLASWKESGDIEYGLDFGYTIQKISETERRLKCVKHRFGKRPPDTILDFDGSIMRLEMRSTC